MAGTELASTELAALAWPEVDLTAVLAVPVGSTEQHGRHLPLSTDTDVAVALCGRLVRSRPGVLVAPAIAYGSSGEHGGFPGTLSIGQQALELVLTELGRCSGFARLLLVNGHGGNAAPLARAVERLSAEGRDVLAWSPRTGGDAHAGRTETSLQLALDAGRVRRELATVGACEPIGILLPALREGRLREISPDGVLGDPTGASAREGSELLDRLAADLLRAVEGRWPR